MHPGNQMLLSVVSENECLFGCKLCRTTCSVWAELMPLCVRFVDCELNIREELLQICTLPCHSHQASAAITWHTNRGMSRPRLRWGCQYEQRDDWRPGPYPTGRPEGRVHSLQWTLPEFGNWPLLQPAYSMKHPRQNEGNGDIFYKQSEKTAITHGSGNPRRAPHGAQTAANFN